MAVPLEDGPAFFWQIEGHRLILGPLTLLISRRSKKNHNKKETPLMQNYILVGWVFFKGGCGFGRGLLETVVVGARDWENVDGKAGRNALWYERF